MLFNISCPRVRHVCCHVYICTVGTVKQLLAAVLLLRYREVIEKYGPEHKLIVKLKVAAEECGNAPVERWANDIREWFQRENASYLSASPAQDASVVELIREGNDQFRLLSTALTCMQHELERVKYSNGEIKR